MRTKVFVATTALAAVLAVLFVTFTVAPERCSRVIPVKKTVRLDVALPASSPQHAVKPVKKGFVPDKPAVQELPERDPITGAMPYRTLLQIEGIKRVLEVKLSVAKLLAEIAKIEQDTGYNVDCVLKTQGDLSQCAKETVPSVAANSPQVEIPPPPEDLFNSIPQIQETNVPEESISAEPVEPDVSLVGIIKGGRYAEALLSVDGTLYRVKQGKKVEVGDGTVIVPVKIKEKTVVVEFRHGDKKHKKTLSL